MPRHVPLHCHNEFSPDGAGKATDAAPYAKALGYEYLGISNHGTTAGLIEHVMACESVGIGYVLGCEIYYMPKLVRPPEGKELLRMSAEEQARISYETKQYHLSVFIKNNTGYKNMCRMITEANKKENFYRRPIVTDEMLEKYHEGLILLTGCISGFVAQHIISDSIPAAFAKFDFFQTLFKENFYVEVMPHQTPGQKKVNTQLIEWANKYGALVVMTGDSHYAKPGDYGDYKLLQAIRGIDLDTYKADYSQLFMHSIGQMQEAWKNLMGEYPPDDYLENSYRIAESCDVTFDRTVQMPDIPGIENIKGALVKATQEGILEKKLYTIGADGKPSVLEPYLAQLTYEINTILAKNFGAYMLMYHLLCKHAKEHSIQVQARGSVCGSLLAYCLGITTIDPIIYGTYFERFCGPDRVDFPDIDLDVPDKHKQFLVDYFKAQYPGAAEQVATFGTFGVLSILKKLTAVMGFENGDAKRFEDAITAYADDLEEPQLDVREMLDIPELKYLERKYKCVTAFCWLFKQKTYIGKHAAGVAVTKGPITDKVAIMYQAGTDSYLTAASMKELERLGVMKADILGLSMLSVLMDAEADAGVKFLSYRKQGDAPANVYDIDDIEEEKVIDWFKLGKTVGFFQSEKRKPKAMYKKLLEKVPGSVKTLAIVNAGNRPASLAEHAFEKYMDALDGKNTTKIGRPIIFQEDIMDICLTIAGMSHAQVAMVLKALKKYTVNNQELEDVFVAGCVANGYKKPDAKELWNSMRRYTFPFAHAAVYTQIAMREAWLAEHHSFSFWYALIKNEDSNNQESKRKRRYYTQHARKYGVWFMLPHVNGTAFYGKVETSVRTYIQEGMTVLEGIGPDKAIAIEQERIAHGNYKSIKDLEDRLPARVFNKTVREACRDGRAFAEFSGLAFMKKCEDYNDTIDSWSKVQYERP